MIKLFKVALPLLAIAVSACSAGGSSSVPTGTAPMTGAAQRAVRPLTGPAPEWLVKNQARAECPQVSGKASCVSLRVSAVPAGCNPSSACGFTPQQIEQAYGITKSLNKAAGTKVALVEVGDYATATADLAAYRKQFNLGTAKLTRYNELGQKKNYPGSCLEASWCAETALDMDMVSATCPKCTIYIMEATNGSSISDLENAEQSAVKLGAKVISNSWVCYGDSQCGDPNFASFFDSTNVAYLGSSGDEGYNNIGGPAVLDSVIAAGGTQLAVSGKAFTETAWSGAGAGCASAAVVGVAVAKPSWQSDPGCSNRTVSDISAEAGCAPGVAEYTGYYGGWIGECGTSVASPLLAGIVALAGNGAKLDGGKYVWSLSTAKKSKLLHNITSGNDGSCGGSYLCTAGTKQFGTYSGPTGWGTPTGIKAL
jgi:subtilase family serine protease